MTKRAMLEIYNCTQQIRNEVFHECDLETQHEINWWLCRIEEICNEQSRKRDKH